MAATRTTALSAGALLVVAALVVGTGKFPLTQPEAGPAVPRPGPSVMADSEERHELVLEAGYYSFQGETRPSRLTFLVEVDGAEVRMRHAGDTQGWRVFRYSQATTRMPASAKVLLDTGDGSRNSYCRIIIDGKVVDETPEFNLGPATCNYPARRQND